jgi:hypothetical protein
MSIVVIKREPKCGSELVGSSSATQRALEARLRPGARRYPARHWPLWIRIFERPKCSIPVSFISQRLEPLSLLKDRPCATLTNPHRLAEQRTRSSGARGERKGVTEAPQSERVSAARQRRRQSGTKAAPIVYVAEVLGILGNSERAIRRPIGLMVQCCDPRQRRGGQNG